MDGHTGGSQTRGPRTCNGKLGVVSLVESGLLQIQNVAPGN